MNYILIDKKPVACPDLYAWAKWIDDATNRRVKKSSIGNVRISTIFLGIDHDFNVSDYSITNTPLIFETMVFGGKLNDYQQRYRTWEEAEEGHEEVVRRVTHDLEGKQNENI